MRRPWMFGLVFLCSACSQLTVADQVAPSPTVTSAPTATVETAPAAESAPEPVGSPWGTTPGLLSFRGNLSRTWYGLGPVPFQPEVAWRYPSEPMCSESTVGTETRLWCGTGWTGQPVVWQRPDGTVEVIFGAYDRAVHFVDANSGLPTRTPFLTGDLIKGSVTMDPDGYPLLYFGSRDNRLRVVALDRAEPEELWALDADDHPGIWNNDWDGNPLIIDDLLIEGGENGFLFAVELHRDYRDGLVTVAPKVVGKIPGWDADLLDKVGDGNASIESSVVVAGNRVYFANSAGRVGGVELDALRSGTGRLVFDWWAGDDIDASMVADPDGSLYVSVELERFLPRAATVGQVVKLDPNRPGNPIVWSRAVPPRDSADGNGGVWATPALGRGVLYVATHPGQLIAIDTATGDLVWKDDIGYHAWSSPVVVDDTLVVSVNCFSGGGLRAYDVENPRLPVKIWETQLGSGCIESTPAIWDGGIYVGSRDGFFYSFGEGNSG